jgi:hypothetical protein
MDAPMGVLAYHLIMTAYGFWLPNDPRGSWSDFVRAWELFLFGGPATRTNERRSLARDTHDIAKRLEAKRHLTREAVHFTGLQARAIARGFAHYAQRAGLIVHACSASAVRGRTHPDPLGAASVVGVPVDRRADPARDPVCSDESGEGTDEGTELESRDAVHDLARQVRLRRNR